MSVGVVIALMVVVIATVVSVLITRRAGIASRRPTTWAGRLPYVLIAVVLVVVGSLLINSGH